MKKQLKETKYADFDKRSELLSGGTYDEEEESSIPLDEPEADDSDAYEEEVEVEAGEEEAGEVALEPTAPRKRTRRSGWERQITI